MVNQQPAPLDPAAADLDRLKMRIKVARALGREAVAEELTYEHLALSMKAEAEKHRRGEGEPPEDLITAFRNEILMAFMGGILCMGIAAGLSELIFGN